MFTISPILSLFTLEVYGIRNTKKVVSNFIINSKNKEISLCSGR